LKESQSARETNYSAANDHYIVVFVHPAPRVGSGIQIHRVNDRLGQISASLNSEAIRLVTATKVARDPSTLVWLLHNRFREVPWVNAFVRKARTNL
jgi:hypothetical protein